MQTNQSFAVRNILAMTLFPFVIGQVTPLHAQHVYKSKSEASRPTRAPKSVMLTHPPEILNLISMRAEVVKTRQVHKRTGGGSAPLRGTENVFQKFVRLELRGTKPGVRSDLRLASVDVSYSVKIGERTKTYSETVPVPLKIDKPAVIDTRGFQVKEGTVVKSSYNMNILGTGTVRSTKYRYHKTEIVSLRVTAKDEAGAVIYRGWWPKAPKPGRFAVSPSRTLTHLDGRKIKAQLHSVVDGLVTLAVKGRIYTMKVDDLSEEDREFLGSVTVR